MTETTHKDLSDDAREVIKGSIARLVYYLSFTDESLGLARECLLPAFDRAAEGPNAILSALLQESAALLELDPEGAFRGTAQYMGGGEQGGEA